MKKVIMFFISVVVLTSCTNNRNREFDTLVKEMREYNDSLQKYSSISVHENTSTVDIYLLDGESEWFDVSVLTRESHCVYLTFYPEEAVDERGNVKTSWKGTPRYYNIYTPKDENIISWGVGGVILEKNGQERIIHFNIIRE